jgi:hypothetical protein
MVNILLSSIASFDYMVSEAASIRSGESNAIENDTLSHEFAKRALTIGGIIAKPEKYHNQHV